MTRLEIRDQARLILAEKVASMSYATDIDLNTFIDDGIIDICMKAKVFQIRDYPVGVSDGVASYPLADDFIEMVSVQNANGIPLDVITPAQIGRVYLIPGLPIYYYIFGPSLSGLIYLSQSITLVDTPTTVGGGTGYYKLDYIALAGPLLDDTAEPTFAVKYHINLAIYAAHRVALKAKNSQLSIGLLAEYAANLGLQAPMSGGGAK
jgi:hypothetical protein